MKTMWAEFKAFALKGNVMDLAVGVVIGGAFGKIVSSLVNDIIMPFVGQLLGGLDFTSLKWVLSPAVYEGESLVKAENALLYGQFLQSVLDFLIVALSVFVLVRALNRLRDLRNKRQGPEAPAAPPAPTTESLLVEIRDILKRGNA